MTKHRLLTLIIENEEDHCRQLEKLITANHPELNIFGRCTSGMDAISTLQTVRPDLLLLDIDLGDMNAFDLLDHITNPNFQIIFTTSYNEYALQAFQVHAVDYLLKPIEPVAFAKAIKKATLQKTNMKNYQLLIEDFRRLSKQYLAINEKQKVQYIPIKDILYLQSDVNYTIVHYIENGQRKQQLCAASLATYETKLMPHDFLRIHQSYLVNPSQIRVFDKRSNQLELACSETLPVARNRRALFDWRWGR